MSVSPSRLAWATTAMALALGTGAGCSLGQGEGEVKSDHLFVENCWNGAYDLQPDFFAGIPYRSALLIRVQRGSDLEEVSDGLTVLVDDVGAVRRAIRESGGEATFPVALPPGVTPPGAPAGAAIPPSGEAIVHMGLYLHASCHNQNAFLSAVRGSITFTSLFSGDPNEAIAEEKLSTASFSVRMGDPRDAPLGSPPDEIPEDRLSTVTGSFSFYFERGQPGQPFP